MVTSLLNSLLWLKQAVHGPVLPRAASSTGYRHLTMSCLAAGKKLSRDMAVRFSAILVKHRYPPIRKWSKLRPSSSRCLYLMAIHWKPHRIISNRPERRSKNVICRSTIATCFWCFPPWCPARRWNSTKASNC